MVGETPRRRRGLSRGIHARRFIEKNCVAVRSVPSLQAEEHPYLSSIHHPGPKSRRLARTFEAKRDWLGHLLSGRFARAERFRVSGLQKGRFSGDRTRYRRDIGPAHL